MSTTTELPYPAVTGDPSKPLVDPSQPFAASADQIAGGYTSVALLSDLAAISAALRRPGMRRKVLGDDGTGVAGRVFELGADLETWTGLATDEEVAARLAKQAADLLTYGSAVTSGYEQSGYRYFVFGADGGLIFGISDDPVPQLIVGDVPQTTALAKVVDAFGAPVTAGFEQSGYRYFTVGPDGRLLFGVTDDAVPQLAVNALRVDDAAGLAAQLIAPLATRYGAPVVSGYEQSGFRYFVNGSDGSLLFGVTDDVVPQFVVNALKVEQLQDIRTQLFGGATVNYPAANAYTQSGRSLVFTGGDGGELGGISDDPFPQPTGAFSPFKHDKGGYIAGTNWDVEWHRDSTNTMQVFSIDKANGNVVRQLSSAGHDHINVHLSEAQGVVTWTTSAPDRWKSRNMRWRYLNGSNLAAPVYAKPGALLTIGDSIGQGNIADLGMGFAALTGAALGLASANQSRGGQQSWQQAMRVGARPTFVTIGAATSVGTAAVPVTALGTTPANGKPITNALSTYPNYQMLTSASTAAERLDGWIADANGVRRRAQLLRASTASSAPEAYSIVSLAGVAITVAPTFQFIVDTGDLLALPAIIEPGTNDLSQGIFSSDSTNSATQILADVRANQDLIVAALKPLCPCYVVTGMFNPRATWAAAGTDVDTAIIAHNTDRRVKYSWRFCDIAALFAAGGDGSANDNSDIAQHWPPRSLVDPNGSNAGTGQSGATNSVHPNNAGHAVIANGNAAGRGTIAILQPQLAALPQ